MAIFRWTLLTVWTVLGIQCWTTKRRDWVDLKGVLVCAGKRRCMHENDLFLIDMAAEGRGHTILTSALQLVMGTTKLLGDPRPTLTSLLLRNGRRKVLFSTSRLSPFPVLMHPLLTSFVVASDDAKSAQQARPMERVYEHFVFVRRWFIRKSKPFAKKEPFRKGQVAISWQGCVVLKFTAQN